MNVVGINRTTRQVVFGEVRWRATAVTAKDVDALIEKSLIWLHGDTARWDVHYAFFAKAFTESIPEDETIHCFLPEDIINLSA